ncbi:MAG TPA: hypothetical protein VLC97_19800 [Rhodanobacteraceae bacterium]|nr:hypothetical protein [Rhodanobacteraceae bacterium]
MQLKWLAVPIISAFAVLSYAPAAMGALSLMPFEEPTVQLLTSNPFQFAPIGSTNVLQPVTSNPLLCSNTSAPASPHTPVSPVYYSPNGLAGLKPFVFGASALTPSVPSFALGATLVYGSAMTLSGDPALVCYGLDATGVHGPTPGGVMRDEFEGVNFSPTLKANFNSSVVLTVFHVPTSPSDYYGYTIDVSIAAAPGAANCAVNDCNFSLLEGFDTSVFATNSSATHPDEGWCIGSAGSTTCSTSTVEGGININYATWPNSFLPHLVAGASPLSYRFVVKRYFASNVTALPASNAPLAIAALFSPFDMDENFIGDNVSAGYANTPPAVVQSGDTWTTFSGKLGALAENTDSGALTFNITDSDTPETGSTLQAAVTLNLAGLQVPVTPNCTLTSGGGTPVNRTCTIDVNFADPNWWNASVGAGYQGQGNLFATDPGSVAASVSIVATDAANKSSAAVTVPIHVQSKVNSPPVVSISAALPPVADSFQANALIPTYSCSTSANSCGSRGYVAFPVAVSALPGPAAAFDELATQTTAVTAYAGGDANGGNVQCTAESGSVFSSNGNPVVSATGSANTFQMDFFLNNPATVGSSLCTVTITDQMAAFPAGESAATTAKQFRIVVSP